MLDVAWAHLCETGASGAFTNPFEARQHLRHAIWGDVDAPPSTTASKSSPASSMPTSKAEMRKVLADPNTRQQIEEAKAHLARARETIVAAQ